ncbi:MAG: imidazolonepropionase [Gemmatimonadota bacterium]|nr:imidazolonepropionase [Gemmatimonadota bacterium]
MTLLFVNAKQVITCAGAPRARVGTEMRDCGILLDAAVAVVGERIAAIGSRRILEREYESATVVDCKGGVLTPGLVDSHTHAIFGKPRYEEQERRAAGADYMEIAKQGGGIHASVRDVRARDAADLLALARPRLARLASYGTTTVEVKSGYGLSIEDELKILRVIRDLASDLPMRIVPTWLGAHEIPREARATPATRASYVKMLRQKMLPLVIAERLAVFADVFCEPGVFTIEETRDLLLAARRSGLQLKLHADELSPSGGAELAAELHATSADHLAAISPGGMQALAKSGTVATLLPGTMLFLGKGTRPPARALLDAGAAVALATDFNPGTSPTPNLPFILTLAVSELHMSVAEAVLAATVNGAAALGLAGETGQLSPGFSADLALFDIEDIRELPYWYADRRCRRTWVRGKACYSSDLPIT